MARSAPVSIGSATRFRQLRITILCLVFFGTLASANNTSRAAERERFLAGQLLVATAEMKDPRFFESVIYMVKIDAEGAMGLVINKPMAKGSIEDLLKGFGLEGKNSKGEIVIHYGGPVAARQGFLLHSDETLLENSTKVADGVAMTADARMFEAIAAGKGPRQSLFILGYAGWAPGQLEEELKMNSWIVVPSDKALIFDTNADKKWRQAIDKQQFPL
jgi:putative transcriptional regulator